MPLKPFIKTALAGRHLDEKTACTAMGHVMRGETTPVQIAAWLIALRLKGETVGEIVGFASAMRDEMLPLPDAPPNALDTCGTGGDDLGTFNISTAAALIAASCGASVAKHGNRAVSSQTGSADVLTALGFEIDPGPGIVGRALRDTGFAFMFAPRFHPAMKHAAAPRTEIGVRTVFNLLGPICNPACVRRQVVGLYDRSRVRQMTEVLGALGAERALVVSGPHGADELLACGDNHIAEWDHGKVTQRIWTAKDFGVAEVSLGAIRGGAAEENASIIREIAMGKNGPKAETAILNAGAALLVAGIVDSISAGTAMAREAVHEGKMAELIERAAAASKAGS